MNPTNTPSASDGWQSIETAPKDEAVLVSCMGTSSNDTFAGRQYVYMAAFEDGGWHHEGSNLELNDEWKVTHWQPIPTPPNAPEPMTLDNRAKQLFDANKDKQAADWKWQNEACKSHWRAKAAETTPSNAPKTSEVDLKELEK